MNCLTVVLTKPIKPNPKLHSRTLYFILTSALISATTHIINGTLNIFRFHLFYKVASLNQGVRAVSVSSLARGKALPRTTTGATKWQSKSSTDAKVTKLKREASIPKAGSKVVGCIFRLLRPWFVVESSEKRLLDMRILSRLYPGNCISFYFQSIWQ